MKKIISFLCLAIFGYIGNLSAQNVLVIKNGTTCSHTIVFYAHDIAQPCGSYVSNAYTVAASTTTMGIPPIQINDMACTPSGGYILGPIGWTGSACIPPTGAFDGVTVDGGNIIGLSTCSSYSTFCSVNCSATATWSYLNYVYYVTIQ